MIDEMTIFKASDNFVENGNFENWTDTMNPEDWIIYNPDNIERSTDSYLDDYSVKLSAVSYIGQNINVGGAGTTVVISFAFKNSNNANNLLVYGNSEYMTIHSNNKYGYWQVGYCITTVLSANCQITFSSMNSGQHVLLDNVNVYSIERETISLTDIVSHNSIINSIEDDIYQFKSSDFSFTIKNKDRDEFFNPGDLLDPEENYTYGVLIRYFNNKYMFNIISDVTQDEDYKNDDIEVETIPLISHLKDIDVYIGRTLWDSDISSDIDEPTSKVVRFDFTTPTSISDVLDSFKDEILRICVGNNIPIYPDAMDVEVDSGVGSDETTIIMYLSLINTDQDGAKKVVDYYHDTENDRLFVLLITNEHTVGEYDGQSIDLYEIINGTSLSYIDTINPSSDINSYLHVAFIHTVESGYYFDLTIYQIKCEDVDDWDVFVWGYKYNEYTGKPECIIRKHHYEEELSLLEAVEYVTLYIDSGYNYHTEGSVDNLQYIGDNQNVSVTENDYFFGDIESSTEVGTIGYDMVSSSVRVELFAFPRKLMFGYSDANFSTVLKDLCIVQDAYWYISYSIETHNGVHHPHMILNFILRDFGDPVEIEDVETNTRVLSSKNKLTKIKFSDLENNIYVNDPQRMDWLLDYNNDKYGGTKRSKVLKMFGLETDYSIGEKVYISSLSDSISFFIKEIEFTSEILRDKFIERTNISIQGVS